MTLLRGLTHTHSPAVLDLYISSDTSICPTVAFPQLENPDHVVVSVSIDFFSNSKGNASFHCIAYDCFLVDWHGLCDHLRCSRISLNLVFPLRLVNFVSWFRLELMYISLIVSIRLTLTHHDGFQLLLLLLP